MSGFSLDSPSESPPPRRGLKRLPTLRRAARALVRYGGAFSVEVLILWSALLAFQLLGYGGRPGFTFGSAPHQLVSLGMAFCAMGAGEARFKLYRRVWSVAGINDAIAVGLAVLEATFLITGANWLLPQDHRAYRLAVPILAAPAAVIGIGLFRLLPRLLSSVPRTGKRLLVVARDSDSYATVKALIEHSRTDWTPVAIVTMAPVEVNRTVMGIPVVGNVESLKYWLDFMQAGGVAFVLDGSSVQEQRDLFALCLDAELPIFLVPSAGEWFPAMGGAPMRRLSADDLVGRAPREMDVEAAREHVHDRTVLVTGAAGSIGSELCRQLAGLRPARMVLVDNNESGLFEIAEGLRAATAVEIREALVSIVDREQLLSVFAEERPDLVFHAAAYKHVPMLESHPIQAVITNVVGTRNTLACAEAAGVKTFILVSTDKAVARHSVMGCTKRVCELLVLSHTGDMRCWAVRFGNVVGSRGSVVPLFEHQIEQGGPVTITHPDITRYMMTIKEAVSLVLTTLQVATPSHLYMLDMGEPINIESLARALIRSRGLRPGTDIEIVYTGLRPGDRLTEDLLAEDEGSRPTAHPSIMEVVSPHSMDATDVQVNVERLQSLAVTGHSTELVKLLKQIVWAGSLTAPDEPPARSRRSSLEHRV
jgi:FlaA1/EpsC-like NDP-sugar epimerase